MNDAFVWGCMWVDLRGITEKNVAEWQSRYQFAVANRGAMYYVNNKDWIPTVDDVRKRIGLTTNVSNRTRKQFEKKILSSR